MDLISRQAAIKATWQDTGYTDPFNVMTAIRDRIQQLPPIHPVNNSEMPNSSDVISRQAAIDALKDWYDGMIISSFRGIEKVIDALPPVQPTIQPDNNLQKLADEIASFKRCVKSENSDYLTGYLCALSVVEGMIADMRGKQNG